MRDEGEFEAVFDRMLGRAYRHALRLVGDRALAEDLASEALTRTYVHWGRVTSLDYRDAWVLRVVTNLAIDAYAKRRVPTAEADPIGMEDAALLRVTLAQALRALPARQRDAVVLRYLVDLSDPDSFVGPGGDTFCGDASFGDGNRQICGPACAAPGPRYGPWSPPPARPSDATFTLAHTYAKSGTFTVDISLTADVCGPRPSKASASVTVHISP